MGRDKGDSDVFLAIGWLVLTLGPVVYVNLAANGVIPWRLL